MAKLNIALDEIRRQVDDEDEALAHIAAQAAAKPSLSPAKNAAPRAANRNQPVYETVVRDGFSMPESDYAIIEKTVDRIIEAKLLAPRHASNKSLVIRMALHALDRLDDEALKSVLKAVPPMQPGRRPG